MCVVCVCVESRPFSVPVKVFPSSEESHVSPEENMKNLITHTWNAVKRLTLQVCVCVWLTVRCVCVCVCVG